MLLSLLFSTARTVCVTHSVSAVIYLLFCWWIVFECLNKNKTEAAVVDLYCCFKMKENKRRQEKKSLERQNKWRGSDVVVV